jgi:hypothetical protein
VSSLPTSSKPTTEGPQSDLAARRLRRLATLLRQTGRPAEGLVADHIAALLAPSNVTFLRTPRGPRP